MPLDLNELAAPAHTAILLLECQRGVMGDLSQLPELAASVRSVGASVEHEHCRAPGVKRRERDLIPLLVGQREARRLPVSSNRCGR